MTVGKQRDAAAQQDRDDSTRSTCPAERRVPNNAAPPYSQMSPPVGAARSVYTNILGRGQEVRFPADTPIQVQLAPNPASQTP